MSEAERAQLLQQMYADLCGSDATTLTVARLLSWTELEEVLAEGLVSRVELQSLLFSLMQKHQVI